MPQKTAKLNTTKHLGVQCGDGDGEDLRVALMPIGRVGAADIVSFRIGQLPSPQRFSLLG
jgi:hypothetical protein